ncbi:MAG: glycosyltransferase family 39 protein [Bryobacterales bacterium]|nr:glycosyltransferase family 39 protein [Bryobacteraceae bacterium]MDW8130100.1 glycosyltransferase family 39 protein [Bryobacterales bacterium]
MKFSNPKTGRLIGACALSLLVLAQGLILMPYAGLQNDEALFGSLIYEPRHLDHPIQVFKRRIPLMAISYLGGLKAWLYAIWFELWPPSISSVRLPVVCAGALSVWLFARLLRQIAGSRAAWIGGLLLASDTSFVLLTTFDWGPVALQHLLLLGALNSLLAFHRSGRQRWLALAFFLFGLAFWDKTVFAWMFTGLAIASLALLRCEIRRAVSPRQVALAALALLVGASPLILYNARSGGATLRQARLDFSDLPGKAHQLRSTLEGSSLFGYLTREDDGRSRLDPPTTLERAALALSDLAGRPRRSVLPFALLLSLLSLPLLTRSAQRALLLPALAMGIAWLQMALIQGAGGSAHHAVLLWPLPHWMVAVALADLSSRLACGRHLATFALAGTIAVKSLLVTNEYLAQFIRHGPGPYWTDAMEPLARRLLALRAGAVVIADWGILDSVRLLSQGRLPLFQAIDLASRTELDPREQASLRWLLELPDPVFAGYARHEQAVRSAGLRLAAHAAGLGYRKDTVDFVADRHGRPVFEIWRFRPISDPGPRQPR